jgi:hypothetical protein
MFASEQHTVLIIKDQTKKRVFTSGTSLVKGHGVKRHFTYRELTLIIGIIVAMAIVILFSMMNRQSHELSSYSITQPELLPSVASTTNTFIQKVLTEILF